MNLQAQDQKNRESPMVCPTGLELYPHGHTHCPTHKVALTPQCVDNIVGKIINDRYEVVENMTAGGWASVYRAKDIVENREVAIKVLHSYLLSDGETVARFKREAKAASALSHPSLAAVYDAGVLSEGQPFIVMEFVTGLTLAERMVTLGDLTAEQAIPLFIQVCEALEFAHSHGIIHRDIKPSNIMLSQTPKGDLLVKMVDFGLARAMEDSGLDMDQITRSGQTIGSPAYMSPEQCLGYKLDARSDIYSLGCTMYEAMTCKSPFIGQSILEYMHKHTYEQPRPVEIRSDEANVGYNMAHVIMQALAKNPEDRQQSMAQLSGQLKACVWQVPQDPAKQEDVRATFNKIATASSTNLAKMPKFHRLRGWLSVLMPVFLLLVLGWVFINVVKHGDDYAAKLPPVALPTDVAPAAQKPAAKPVVSKSKHHK
ncbi:MAG TPA: serine/threonine-protein kinase [Candidatus Obscuribacterales bacterium]